MIRTTVFVDYEDIVAGAERAFKPSETLEIDPLRLSRLLISSLPGRSLDHVRVYRSIPDPRCDLSGFGDTLEQIERWRGSGITVVRRSRNHKRNPITMPAVRC